MRPNGPDHRYLELAEKWLNGTITAAEEKEFALWYNEDGQEAHVPPYMGADREELRKRILSKINEKINEGPVEVVSIKRHSLWKRMAVAASILLVIGSGTWYFILRREADDDKITAKVQHTGTDILPGLFRAKLTLADGKSIILDSAALGELVKQGNTAVINKDGQLIYSGSQSVDAGSQLLYNTVATNKGETYSLTLADGSIVSLNAGSSIYFPVAFPGKQRRITVSGEVYIKVAKNPAQPFIAVVNGMEVEALGTEFNISAYDDEAVVKTTLAEGSVRVTTAEGKEVKLKPGQQAILTGNSELTTADDPDMEKTLAWVSGKFVFERDELPVIMRQLSRWYDVEVVYEGKLPAYHFSGIISRQRNASAVLEMLRATGNIHFRIEGNKIIVTP